MKTNKVLVAETIKLQQQEIDKVIHETFPKSVYVKQASTDGVVQPKLYVNEPVKIMWVMKEINKEDGDGYCQRDLFNRLINEIKEEALHGVGRKKWKMSLDPIIYITNQIMRGCIHYSDVSLPYITEDPSIVNVLQKIAYVNIKKIPGGATSNNNKLQEFYEKGKEIFFKQLEVANPDIVICGNTLRYFKNDLQLKSLEKHNEFKIDFASTAERIFINIYHPMYLSLQPEKFREEYYNAIIDIIKKWKTQNQIYQLVQSTK